MKYNLNGFSTQPVRVLIVFCVSAPQGAEGRATRFFPRFGRARCGERFDIAKSHRGGCAMATLKPLNDRIVVKAVTPQEKTAGGIFLPDSAQEKPQEAEVVAVGPGKLLENGKLVPVEVKPGDIIIYAKYGGTEIKLGNQEYTILRQEDVLAIKE
jgi:chaperonin GroES